MSESIKYTTCFAKQGVCLSKFIPFKFCALFSLYKQAGTAIRQPDYPGPSDFLVLALTTLILCGLLNLTSLFMSIPALIFASLVG